MLPQFPKIVAKRDQLNTDHIRRAVRERAPMLRDISSHIVHEGKDTAIARVDGETEATDMKLHSAMIEIPSMPVQEFIERHPSFLDTIAEQFAKSQSEQVIEAITASTEKTGNIIDGKGQGFSDDLIYKTLDALAHSFGSDGQWEPPSMIVSPEQYEKIIEYDKSRTPEQRAEFDRRLKQLILRKKAEYDSEQAGRILAG